MNIQYKKRKNSEFKLITSEESKTNSLTTLLDNKYPYILQSMKKENYKIEYDSFEVIHEIVNDEEVVGILSIINIDALDHTICINEAYILPDYRKQGLFYQTLMNLLSQPNMTVSLRNPNRYLIELLINYKFAKKLENDLVISFIDFYVDYDNRYENKQIRDFYKDFEKKHQKDLIRSNYYDLNINSCVFFDIDNVLEFNDNPAFIEKARKVDSNDENYFLKLKNVDRTYLEVLVKRLYIIDESLIKFFQDIKERINNYLNVDYILGTEKELTPLFIDLLEKNNLSIANGFFIRELVVDALEREEIIPKTIVLRTVYLIEHFSEEEIIKVDDDIALGYDLQEKCPYCHESNFTILEACRECGYNLQRNNHFEENLPQIISRNLFLNDIIPECQIKEELNENEDKLSPVLVENLFYLDFNPDEVYERQSKIATYQLLKNLDDVIYFDIFDYDQLNSIRKGTAFNYAKKHHLIEELKDYTMYFEIMEVCFTVEELENILTENNCSNIGTREELINRIETNLSPHDIFGKKYTLTKEGKNFLKEHMAYDYFINYCSRFHFYEFSEFVKRYEGKFEDICESFLKYMEEIAVNYDDFYKYHNVLEQRLSLIEDKYSDEYLVLFTQIFIIDINYWLNTNNHEQGDKPLSMNITDEYPDVIELFVDKEIVSIFNEANSRIPIESLKEHEDFALFYLFKSFEYEDIDDINREVEYDTFKEEFINSIISH